MKRTLWSKLSLWSCAVLAGQIGAFQHLPRSARRYARCASLSAASDVARAGPTSDVARAPPPMRAFHPPEAKALTAHLTSGALGPDERDAAIFAQVQAEARELSGSSLLGGAVRAQVLESGSLAQCLAKILARRLGNARMLPAPELEGHIEAALRDDPRPAHDIAEIVRKDPAAVSYLQTCLFLKGFHAVQAQRVARTFWERGDFEGQAVAFAIQNRVSELWSVDVHPAARLGGGLLMDHATGIVIGETAVVGERCTILHSVTLGGTGKERGDRHPKIGDDVTLGAGSTVLGNIVVGDGATVGSQAVCTRAVPPGMTVVGLNKLLDPNKDAEVKEVAKQRQETWQYELGVGGYGSYGGTGVQNWDI